MHDDGLQLISEEERKARITFYADHNIGWVARPPHSSAPDGFKRAGRFKKASNMSCALGLSLKAECHLETLLTQKQRHRAPPRTRRTAHYRRRGTSTACSTRTGMWMGHG